MRPLFLAGFLCAAASMGVACGDDDSDDDDVPVDSGTRNDAGPDSSVRDGGIDASTDAGNRVDGGSIDAAIDSAVPKDATAGDAALATSSGSWNVYTNPYGDGGVNSASGVGGSAVAVRTATGMTVTLSVTGLSANRTYGSHIHKLSCSEMMAGGHYQHNAAPADASTDPAYANPSNEVWLDFTTNASGAATATATVNFVPRTGEAKAVIIHDHGTMDGGVAGPKLACINIAF